MHKLGLKTAIVGGGKWGKIKTFSTYNNNSTYMYMSEICSVCRKTFAAPYKLKGLDFWYELTVRRLSVCLSVTDLLWLNGRFYEKKELFTRVSSPVLREHFQIWS